MTLPPMTPAQLATLIDEAIAQAYDQDERLAGFFALMERRLALPFETAVFGAAVTVTALTQDHCGTIFAVCEGHGERHRLPVEDLPLPSPLPAGAEAIEAFRAWLRDGSPAEECCFDDAMYGG